RHPARYREDFQEQVFEPFAVYSAEVTDGAEVGAVVPDDGQEGEIALTGGRDLAAGDDADAGAVDQQGGHHDEIIRWCATGLALVVSVEGVQVELRDQFDEEEDQIVLREDFGGDQGLLGILLGLPGAKGLARLNHDRPPDPRQGTSWTSSRGPILLNPGRPRHQTLSKWANFFQDGLLETLSGFGAESR